MALGANLASSYKSPNVSCSDRLPWLIAAGDRGICCSRSPIRFCIASAAQEVAMHAADKVAFAIHFSAGRSASCTVRVRSLPYACRLQDVR